MEYITEFIPGERGKLFYLVRKPKLHAVKFVMIVVQPFAEEANKSRHMMSRLADALVPLGGMIIIYDHFGTGDSEGEFSQANIEIWRNDLESVANDLLASVKAPLTICAVRTGALITLGLSATLLSRIKQLYFINPVLNGEQFIGQFFRLRMAGGLLVKSDTRSAAADIRTELQHDGLTEVAGYQLSAQLVSQLEAFDLEEQLDKLSAGEQLLNAPVICWLEVNTRRLDSVMPASQKYIDMLRSMEVEVEEAIIEGQQFWATQEITYSNNLIAFIADHLTDLIES